MHVVFCFPDRPNSKLLQNLDWKSGVISGLEFCGDWYSNRRRDGHHSWLNDSRAKFVDARVGLERYIHSNIITIDLE